MRIPLSWLKEYVEIKESPEKISGDLLLSGTKVESVEKTKDDHIFEFEITPNRADCLSVIGIAREIAAIYKRTIAVPPVFSDTQIAFDHKKKISLLVKDKELCPRYSLGVITNVKAGPSPDWMADRLEKSGVRSLNNIIDITNYVMLETGQPMHAFDYDKIAGEMILRSSREGETVTTLDGIERKLPAGAIIIEDSEKLIDLAGLMGGRESEVDENTTNIILHVPLYNPLAIRRASQATGLRTEASTRFEKQLDPAAHRFTFERAAELFRTIASGALVTEIESIGYPPQRRTMELPISLIRRTLGVPVTNRQILDILERLEFEVNLKGELLNIGIPSFRTDIAQPIDLTEEVGRLYGYNKFPKTLPASQLLEVHDSVAKDPENEIKQQLVALGLKEIYTTTLTSAQVLENLGLRSENCLKVNNRLVIDYEYLRPTLFAGLLTCAGLNRINFDTFGLFEIGRIFEKTQGEHGLPTQPKKIGVLFVGSNFRHAKGVLDSFLNKFRIPNVRLETSSENYLLANPAANIFSESKLVGVIGGFAPAVLSKFDIDKPTFGFELDLELITSNLGQHYYHPLPNFPTVKENISLFLPNGTNYAAVEQAVKKGAGANYFDMELAEDTVIAGRRSLLIAIKYYDSKHTLVKGEIEKIRESVLKHLETIGAEVRTAK